MQCLTDVEVKAWLAGVHFEDVTLHSAPVGRLTTYTCGYLSRVAAAESMAVIRKLDDWLWYSEPSSCLVSVVETGIWSSSENLSLYYSWRQSLHIHTSLDVGRGHVFLPFERDHFMSLLQMSLIFGWGFLAASAYGDDAFAINHDGKVVAFTDVPQRAAELCTALAPLLKSK